MSFRGRQVPTPTLEDIAALVAKTYSDDRPDPYKMTREAEWIYHTIERAPSCVDAKFVAYMWISPTYGVPNWEPDFAERLEEYLHKRHDEDGAERRMAELQQGAPLDQAEKEAYEDHYWSYQSIGERPAYYLQRLHVTLPSHSAKLSRPPAQNNLYSIYFLGEFTAQGPQSDLLQAAGPFRSPEEVMDALTGQGNSPFDIIPGGEVEFDDSWDAKITAALKDRYNAIKQGQA